MQLSYVILCVYTWQEEDRIVKKESTFLKEKIGAPDIAPVRKHPPPPPPSPNHSPPPPPPPLLQRQMREYLIRLIYCEMLGVECSWGYIHAVKLTQSAHPLDKRIGELVM